MTRTYKTLSEAMSAVGAKEYRMTAGKWNTDNAGTLSRFDVPTRTFVQVASYSKVGDTITVYDLPTVPDKIEPNHLFT